MPDDPTDRLDSWKEIAPFIGKDVRTAMRWSRQGMPVHRIPGGKQGRVYSSRAEITQWLDRHHEEPPTVPPLPPKTNAKLTLIWAAGIGTLLILVVLLAAATRLHSGGTVARVLIEGNTVHAFDAEKREQWSYRFPHDLDPSILGNDHTLAEFVRIADLRGDGRKEVLLVAPYRLGPNPNDTFRVEVDCFSDRGQLLWSFVPNEQFRFGTHEVGAPWAVHDLFLSHQTQKPVIWVSADHPLWGNSFVAQLDAATGHETVRFVNTGVIYKINEMVTPRGTYLLVGGFNNEYEGGSLAIIDERTPFAASPQTSGTRHQCLSCPEGAPDYYLVFPRSEINEQQRVYEHPVRLIQVNGTEIQLVKYELQFQKEGVATVYLLRASPEIEPVSLRFDSKYDMLHQELNAQGKLHHSLRDCPERLHPRPVRLWTPAKGWTTINFNPAGASD